MTSIPFMIFTPNKKGGNPGRFFPVYKSISKAFPQTDKYLKKTTLNVIGIDWIAASLKSALFIAVIVSLSLLLVQILLKAPQERAYAIAGLTFVAIFILLFLVLMTYPQILSEKTAQFIERDLVFALKDMLLELSSGGTLYTALKEISFANYGLVSEEFSRVVAKIDTGIPEDEALETLALSTSSEYLRYSLWQLINTIKAGSGIDRTLHQIIDDLVNTQRRKIRNYAQELNLLTLMYMLFSVVLPTIATTLLIVVGPFMGIAIGQTAFYVVVPVSFTIQLILLGFIKSRRPQIQI